jgi:uncharacterized repeat protein (TIGR01451 family)
MAGPRIGRILGAVAAATVVAVVVRVLAAMVGGITGLWAAPLALGAIYFSMRLFLLAAVTSPAPRDSADPRVDQRNRVQAAAALRTLEVAVICDGETMVAVRTAVLAAVAATSAERVMLVGADPRLDQVARALGVHRVPAAAGRHPAMRAAINAARGEHLLLAAASTAVIPGSPRRAVELFGHGCVWVQTDVVAPPARTLLDHVRHHRLWASIDRRRAAPWMGTSSIVLVSAFKTALSERGEADTTVALQAHGWHGRWSSVAIAVEQDAAGIDPRVVSMRADRLRQFRGRRSPLWTPKLTVAQRMTHLLLALDDLAGSVTVVVSLGVCAALVGSYQPVPNGRWAAAVSAAFVLAWIARLLLTGGIIRPFALARANAADVGTSVRALVSSLGPARSGSRLTPVAAPRRGWRSRLGALLLILMLDIALVVWALRMLGNRDRVAGLDPVEMGQFVIGVGSLVALLAGAHVLRRNRRLGANRRMTSPVTARIGEWQGKVVDMGAGGLRVVFGAPIEILAVVPMQLIVRGNVAVDVRVQVVRVEAVGSSWLFRMRLIGGGLAGEHDDYLAFWLAQMAGAVEDRPRVKRDPAGGRMPVRAAGTPMVRLATAAALILVALAVLPNSGSGRADSPAAPASLIVAEPVVQTTLFDVDAPAVTAETTPVGPPADSPDSATGAGPTVPDSGGSGNDDERGSAELGPTSEAPTTSEPLRDQPLAVAGEVLLSTVVDDTDRHVGGGQAVVHTATVRNDGTEALTDLVVDVSTFTSTIATATFAGSCPGAAAGRVIERATGTAMTWTLFAVTDATGTTESTAATGSTVATNVSSVLEAGDECTLSWTQTVPAATELQQGQQLKTSVAVTAYRGVDAGESASRVGPTVTDVLIAERPTLRVITQAGDGTDVDDMTIGQPFTWVVKVTNISAGTAIAHNLDIVDLLPPNWTYSATASVLPQRCDVAPVVLVDDATSTQAITWSDMCDLAPGQELIVTFTATPQLAAALTPGLVDADGGRARHINTVDLSAEDLGGFTLGTARDRAVAYARSVDLTVRLTDTGPDDAAEPDSPGFSVGAQGRYRIDVVNNGPDATTGTTTVTHIVPAGVFAFGAAGDGWTCVVGLAVVCTHPGAVGVHDALPPIEVAVAVGAAALGPRVGPADVDGDPTTGAVVSTVSVAGTDLDRDSTNNADDETTPIRRNADVAVTGELSAFTPLVAGARIDYILSPSIVGPSPIDGVLVLDDPVPTGLRMVNARGAGWTCGASRIGSAYGAEPDTNGSLSCRRTMREVSIETPIDPLVVTVQVDPSFTGTSATWSIPGRIAGPGDRNPANDIADPAERIAGPSALSVVAVAFDEHVVVGDDIAFDVQVTNLGPARERGPVVVDGTLPDGVSVTEVAGDGWDCSSVAADDSTSSYACTWVGDDSGFDGVEVGGVLPTVHVSATVAGAAITNHAPSAIGRLVHDVRLTGTTDRDEHASRIGFAVMPAAELTIALIDADAAWTLDEPNQLQLVVGNDGPSGEYGPVIAFMSPVDGLELVAAGGDGWECGTTTRGGVVAEGTLRCEHGRSTVDYGEPLLASGARLAPIDVTLTPRIDGVLETSAMAAGVTADQAPEAGLELSIGRRSDLSLQLDVGGSVTAGATVDATWTVHNAGPSSTDEPVVVVGAIPSKWHFVEGGTNGWACEATMVAVTCRFDRPIEPGDEAVNTVTFGLDRGADTGELTLAATLAADSADPDADNNDDEFAIRVRSARAATSAETDASPTETPTASVPGDESPASTIVEPVGSGADGQPAAQPIGRVVAGYAGAAGAFGLALILLLGRRRPIW